MKNSLSSKNNLSPVPSLIKFFSVMAEGINKKAVIKNK